jgi:hypothetical protein
MSRARRLHHAKQFVAPLLLLGLPLAWLGVAAVPAGALTVINVTTNSDSGTGSLRAAMTTALGTSDDVEIDLATGLGTITLGSALPAYNGGGTNHTLTVHGNGATVVGFAGTNVFETTGGSVGGMSFDDITVSGGDDGIFANSFATIMVTNSTITGAADEAVNADGGAITINNSTISDPADDAVDTGTGDITINDSTINDAGNDAVDTGSGSTVTVTGSALLNPGNAAIDDGDNNTVTVSRSTLAGSQFDAIDTGDANTIDVTNSTITASANSAIGLGNNVTESFAYDTITGNGTNGGDGQITGGTSVATTFFGTVLAAPSSSGSDCAFGSGSTVTSQGFNHSNDASCSLTQATDKQNAADPMLGALGANGGIGETMVPAAGSPLIDAIPPANCQTGIAVGVGTDERGINRPQGSGCDIGAVEVAVNGPNPNGYRLVADEGGIFDFGLNFDGSLANNHLNAPIVGIANSPGFDGYLMAGGDGGVFALGGANFYGSLGGQSLPSPIAAIAAPPSENGYWLVAANGKVYNFGAVPALAALSLPAGAHIVGMASSQDGGGAWMTDQFGDVYAEGDAQFVGGLGGIHLNAPIVGIAAAAKGQGYVLAATDGGAFAFGTQHFFGSVPGSLAPGQHLNAPIIGIAVTHSGNGYWFAGADGGVFNYGDAPFLGSIYTAIPGKTLNGPIVGIQHLGSPPA